ncbi:MAG TPA: chromosome partitioning protein ParA, partial [Alphaproteobacteria bacterium]|nr:chromosome partitioning protein ParA [Alphaproteobacteria bacterium]
MTAGYETALGAALGEDLAASTDEAAPVRWTTLPPLDALPLPGGLPSLDRFVRAPTQLARRLAAIGVAGTAAEAARLSSDLAPGQRLVSRDGGLWRWDGFVVAPGTATPTAARLAQRNRLDELRAALGEAEAGAGAAREAAEAAAAALREAGLRERAAREEMRESFGHLNAARETHAKLQNTRSTAESRLSALADSLQATRSDREEASAELDRARTALDALQDATAHRERLVGLRAELAELRAEQAGRRSAHDRLAADAERRAERLADIATEAKSWEQRAQGAAARLSDLESRRAAAGEEDGRLAARPDEIEAQRVALMDRIAEAETRRQDAADRLAAAESAQAEADRALRTAEAALAEAREAKVRAEAQFEQAEHERNAVAERIREKLDTGPDGILAAGGIDDEDLPGPEEAASRLERAMRERDAMGPVNLRAEKEAEELQLQIESLRAERDDLVAAIARLRQGIAALN